MKKLLFLPIALLLFNCTTEDKETDCAKINAFYNQQQVQVLKQTNPDKNQLKGIEEERKLRLKQSGCN